MKTKFGAIIVAGSGKIGGHVASRNRAGSYLRTKVTPVNPRTSAQSEARNRLSALASSWSALDADERRQWNDSVGSFKSTDVFGDIKNPSGFNLFVALNNNLVRIGETPIDVPPLPQELPVIETGTLAAVAATSITVTFTEDPDFTDSVIEAYATPSVSQGVSFVKSELRRIGKFTAVADHVLNLKTAYDAKYGAVGLAGTKIFVALKQISKTSGQMGVPVIHSAIIA